MKKMLWQNRSRAILLTAAACLGWAGASSRAQAPQAKPSSDQPKTAEQQFKNIQVLKNIPADQLIPSMQFIAASLGVDCEFCHVEHQMDKDEKKTKQAARKMISMVLTLDRTSFEGALEVTCYTCHRGAAHPDSIPALGADAAKPAAHVHEDEGEEDEHAKLPSSDQILDKYLAAVGGANALMKIKTRVLRGTIDAMGSQNPIEIYAEAPDKRISISHPHSGPSITAFNGEVGWLTTPAGVHQMTPAEREAARIDAQLYFPARLRSLYKEFHVHRGEEVAGRQTVVVSAQPEIRSSQFIPARPTARPALRLYFDQENGLLLRLVRYAETPLGRNPTQIDYSDFRENDGVKIPYRWTLTRPNGSFTIRIDKVEQNVPIDEKLFLPPPSEPTAKQ